MNTPHKSDPGTPGIVSDNKITTELYSFWIGDDWIIYGVRGGELFKRTMTYTKANGLDDENAYDEGHIVNDVTEWVTVESAAFALWSHGLRWDWFNKAMEANKAGYESADEHDEAKSAEAKRAKAIAKAEAKLATLKAA